MNRPANHHSVSAGLACRLPCLAPCLLAALLSGCGELSRSRDLANPAVSGATLAQQVCASCHGLNGQAVSPNFPNLAGQPEAYLVAQLRGFRSHDRSDPAGYVYMWGISRSLSDDQIQGLASYFAGQAPQPQPVEGSPPRIAAGRAIFEQGLPAQGVPACGGCHGDRAQGQAIFARLAGQHVDYLVKQLRVFADTDQRPAGNPGMTAVAHALTAQNIVDVASFLQALPAP